MVLRGKGNRTVAVLLTSELIQCIEIILECRKTLHISNNNPYVFALPSKDKNNHRYASACEAMRFYFTEKNFRL